MNEGALSGEIFSPSGEVVAVRRGSGKLVLRDRELDPDIWELLGAARSKSTRETYRKQWLKFRQWCETAHRSAEPATLETVLSYLTHLTRQPGQKTAWMSWQTVNLAKTAILVYHRVGRDVLRMKLGSQWHEDLWPIPEGEMLKNLVSGYRKTLEAPDHPWEARTVDALHTWEVDAMVSECERDTPKGKRDAAMLLMHLDVLARGAEIAGLRLRNIIPRGDAIELEIRGAKTGSRDVVIEATPDEPELCPVEAWYAWRDVLVGHGGVETGPAFIRWGRWGVERHTDGMPVEFAGIRQRDVTDNIKRLADVAGIAGTFSAHSMRYGPVIEGLEEDESLYRPLKMRGGWKSDSAFAKYANRARTRRTNPIAEIRANARASGKPKGKKGRK